MVSSPQGMALTLTGGHDTRMLLACLGKLSSEIDCLTICPESSIHVDRVIPEQLSIQFGLRHVWVQPLAADKTGEDLFVRRSAHCYGDTNKIYFKTLRSHLGKRFVVVGVGGENARATLTKHTDIGQPLSPESLLRRLKFNPSPRLVSAMKKWLNGLADFSPEQQLDNLYSEQRIGGWYGTQGCSNPGQYNVAPLITYKNIELMHRLDLDSKLRSQLTRRMNEHNWPSLADVSLNTVGTVKNLVNLFSEAIQNPRKISGKISGKIRKVLS